MWVPPLAWSVKSLMRKYIVRYTRLLLGLRRDGRGITGLETAIVLIAFVVVSSVFAFAAMSTGLLNADKTKETIRGGLSRTRATMELKGSVIARAGTTGDVGANVDQLVFIVASAGGESVNLSPGNAIIKYSDAFQTAILATSGDFSLTPIGIANSDNVVEVGELVQVTVKSLVNTLDPDLATADLFVIEIIPPDGAVLNIQRTTPPFLQVVNDLK